MTTTEEGTGSRVLSIRLPNDLADEIVRRADEVDRSTSWYIKNALQVMVEQLQTSNLRYPDPLPESESGQCPSRFTATFDFRMPLFSFPEDADHTIAPASDQDRIGTERRIESALNECAHVLRRWGCKENIVIHSIYHVGGAQLPSRITHFPEGTTSID